jgi:hypothetical protein
MLKQVTGMVLPVRADPVAREAHGAVWRSVME